MLLNLSISMDILLAMKELWVTTVYGETGAAFLKSGITLFFRISLFQYNYITAKEESHLSSAHDTSHKQE